MGEGTLRDCFERSFLERAEKKAIAFQRQGKIETEISYLKLEHDANRMANTFAEMGVEKGDRVIFFFEKSLFYVVAYIALQKLGAISVPLNPGFKKSEMEYLIADADPKMVLVDEERQRIIDALNTQAKTMVIHSRLPYEDLDYFRSASEVAPRVEIHLDDPGVIIYTSGTTGKPKGAILTQRNLVHDAKNVVDIWRISESDILCHALPLFHVHGLCFALHTAMMAGSFVILLDQFSPQTVIDTLARKDRYYACTLFMAVPSMYAKLMDYLGDRKEDFDHVRLWTSGSAPLLVKDFDRIATTFGKEPVEREGMSETGMNFSNPVQGKRKPGSIGLPLPGLQVRIVDLETLQDVERGQTGEILLKSESISPGYWKKPDETNNAFTEGWFKTGDLGRIDEEGYYYLTDRIKHIIISGGENISPKEVEMVINQLENVSESSVVGIPDAQWGEKVVAVVVPKLGVSIDVVQIQNFCKSRLHNWKCPKEIIVVNELPKNTMGKVLKEEVKKIFQG
jgi:malonyl-CoA/methylmalonyl-CoA synthetase